MGLLEPNCIQNFEKECQSRSPAIQGLVDHDHPDANKHIMKYSTSQVEVHQTHSQSKMVGKEAGTANSSGQLDAAPAPCLPGSDSPGGSGRGRGRGGRTARGRGRCTLQQLSYQHNIGYSGAAASATYCSSGRLPGAVAEHAANGHQAHIKVEQPQESFYAGSYSTQQTCMQRLSAATAQPGIGCGSQSAYCEAAAHQQQQLGLDLVLSPTGLLLPKLEPTLGAGCTAAAASSDAWQLPKQRNSNLQLPGTGLLSPGSCPFELGPMSSLGLDRTFSSELAGLQPWIPDQSTFDASSIGSFHAGLPQFTAAPVGGLHSEQQEPRTAQPNPQQQAAVGQMTTTTGPATAAQQYNQTSARPMVHDQQQIGQLMQQQLPAQPNVKQPHSMPPPISLGSQGIWNHQQPPHVQQQGARRNLQHCYDVPYMQAPSQQRPQMQQLHPHPPLTGAFNQGFRGNPNIGCNDIVPPPPCSSTGYVSRPGGSQAAAVPTAVHMYGNRYQAVAPPPLALPGTAAGPVSGTRPGRGHHTGSYGVGFDETCARPAQHMGHNAAGILSELEAIKGPAMQGLVDTHCANQQQRISVSALLDAVPFRMSTRRLSQGLDPLSSSHQRLSLYGLGSDVLDIFGDGLDLDAFLGYGGVMGGAENISSSSADMVAPIAPGSRTTVKVQGEAAGQWQSAAAMAAAAFNSLAAGAGLPAPTSAAPPESTTAAGPSIGGQVHSGVQSTPMKGDSTGVAADTVADRTAAAVDASSGGQYGQKRQRSSAANVTHGLMLDLGATTKRQRVSGLLMELDTPSIRAMAGPLLSPRPQRVAHANAPATMSSAVKQQSAHVALAQQTNQSASGRPVGVRHKAVLDLRSPASQQLNQPHLQQQQQQQQEYTKFDNDPDVVKDRKASPTLAVPPPAFHKQHQLMQQQPSDIPASQSSRPAACVLNLADEPYVPSASTSAAAPLLSSTLSGPVGALGAAVNGDGCVAQVTVTKAGSKGFLPAMHEIEKMI